MKANQCIRAEARKAGVFLWEIAEALQIADATFSRKLRKELSDDEKARVRAIIAELSRKAVI